MYKGQPPHYLHGEPFRTGTRKSDGVRVKCSAGPEQLEAQLANVELDVYKCAAAVFKKKKGIQPRF